MAVAFLFRPRTLPDETASPTPSSPANSERIIPAGPDFRAAPATPPPSLLDGPRRISPSPLRIERMQTF